MKIRDTEWAPEEFQEHVEECIENVQYAFSRWLVEGDALDRARFLMELNDAISALASWHRGYDYETGTLPWEREDNE